MNAFLIKYNQANLHVVFMPDILALAHCEFKYARLGHGNAGAFEEWYTVMTCFRPSWMVTKSGAIIYVAGNEQYVMVEAENAYEAVKQYERIVSEDIINEGVGGFECQL